MSGFASKNLYELLGNDPEQDPDREQPPPVQPVDKPAVRVGKRNAPAEAPAKETTTTTSEAPRGGRGGRGRGRGRGDFAGNEGAFRDRDAGRSSNRDRPVEDGLREDRNQNRLGGDRPRREFGENYNGRGERRGGREFRGGRGGRGPRDDRHSRGVTSDPNDHAKQAAHGWGDATGVGEWKDEQAGAAIASAEEKDTVRDAGPDEPTNADGEHPAATIDTPAPLADEPREPEPEPEPEDKSKSYATYLAELAEKKLGLGSLLTARQANEGSNQKFEGKAIERTGGSEAYFSGSGGKARRERERKDKNVLQLEHDIQAREQSSGSRGARGGAGRGRGRGEGGFRGDRGERGERGGRGRGGFRGESRGEYRGGRGGGPASPNVTNESDFPTLGGK